MKETSPSQVSRDLLRLRFSAQQWHDAEAHLFINSLFVGRGMSIVAVGMDPAKSVFAVHGIDEGGKPALAGPGARPDAYAAGPVGRDASRISCAPSLCLQAKAKG